ncbi:MAG: Tfp pilus assembly protein FimT/FimU, partial [Pirellulales bacterium]
MPKRRAFTLVELLVTIVIIMMLTAIAIPVLAPALAGRRQREASREVTSYFAQARDTAMSTGRATGVMLERFTGAGNASTSALIKAGLPAPTPVPEMCLTLWQVEVPPPYSGDTLYSRALVVGGFGSGAIAGLGTPGGGAPEGFGLVRIGDYIKFNAQGHQYQIISGAIESDSNIPYNSTTMRYLAPPTSANPWQIVPTGGTTALVPDFPLGVPYQIMRQPVKTSTPPLQLPEGIVVDLAASGMMPASTTPITPFGLSFCPLDDTNANQPFFPNDVIPVVVLFSPTGSVERIACSGPDASGQPTPYALPPTTPIFLLLGQRDKVPAANSAGAENWRDPTNLWITIFPQNGLVT